MILGYVFLKQNILFYNLDQNVFTKDDFNICIRNDFLQ